MKIRFTPFIIGSAFLLSLFSGSVVYGALVGNYTINSGAAASASNYTSVGAAVSDLMSGTRIDGGPVNGPGVSGAVMLRIASGSGPYTEQITIGAIAGASAANTVTLSGGSTMETITFANATAADRQTVKLSGANYVILDSLTIVGDGLTYGIAVHITNNSDYNIVRNCSISVPLTTTSANFSALAISGASATTTGNNGDYNLIENNVLSGGYYCINVYGTSTSVYGESNHVINNQIIDFYYYGLRHYMQNGATISGNTVRARQTATTAAYGMYIYYNKDFTLTKNRVYDVGTYSVYMAYTNYLGSTVGGTSLIANNYIGGTMLGTTVPYGIYMTTQSNNNNIYHNSVSFISGNGRPLYIVSGSNNNVRNNSFAVFNSTTGYAAYVSSAAYISTMDYNNYYAAGSSNFIYIAGAYDATTYVGGGGFNLNSRDGDPNYVDPSSDLHAFAAQLYDGGDATVGVLDDYDGDIRPNPFSTLPDIGADEYLPDSLDVSPLSILDPTNFICPDSSQLVRVVIGNRGLNTVTGFTVGVNISGASNATLSTTYTGSLALGATDTVIVGTYNNWPGGASSFAAYTALSGDQTITNDTLTESIDIALTPMSPSATSASVCQGDSAQLVTSSTGTTYWYDAPMSGNLVAAGDTLNTGPLAASTNYYVESRGSVTAGLTTTFAGGNSCGGGNMFDITAISEVTLDSFDLNMSSSANVDIYYKVGTYVGFEGTAAAWTLLGSYAVTSAGVNTPSRCLIGGLTIPAGQTYGIFVSTTTIAYTTLTGGTTYSSPEMSIYSGTGLCGLFSGFNFPRGFNGTVYYQAEGCASQRTEVPVTVTSLPVVNLQDSAYCGSAVLDAGSGGSGYLWSNSATTQTTTVTTSGQYSVMVSNGNCSTGDTANIVINPFPVVNLGTDTTLCDGASLTLDAGNPGGTYMWSTSATTQTISVSGAGSYTAMVNSQDGCQGSDDIVIGVLDSPAGIASNDNTGCPMIAFAGTSTGGPSSTTTWDFGDGNTGTGFNPNHTYAANGQYTVTYTQINDCGTSVSTVTVDINCITGIEDPAAGTAVIFPNPTQNTASLQLELNTSGPASVVLTDITGKVISVRNFDLVSGTTSIPFDMTSFSKGIYIVKVSSETFNWHGKLIRE